ncbi:MAG: serine/threonine protein kinase [Deltaproteobacteria bacterium]|nr:serine/threonine protein kinase [Deltaproteobacteria bacterium]
MKTAALEHDGPGIHVGRYLLHRQIARGGMATIHIARLVGDEGFSRIVAAKRLLPEFAEDADFVTMFLDEARVASKIHHSNVVPVLDVVADDDNVILIQEYVHGAALDKLLRLSRQARMHMPIRIAVAIATQVLAGLQAAHDTSDEVGMPLNIVHRDVSPQNIMVAVDGAARLLDFGVAKATMAAHITREHTFKGKIAYSPVEQLHGSSTPQSDVYSLAVVLWESIVGCRLFQGAAGESEIVAKIMTGQVPTIAETLGAERELLPPGRWAELMALEPVIRKGLAFRLPDRWLTARAFSDALVATIAPAPMSEVAPWVRSLGKELIEKNDKVLAEEEASWRRTTVPLGRELRTASEQRGIALVPDLEMELEISHVAAQESPAPTPIAWWRRPIVIGLGAAVPLAILLALVFRGSPAAQVQGAFPPVSPAARAPEPVVSPLPAPAAIAPAPAPAPSASAKHAIVEEPRPTAELAIDEAAIEVQVAHPAAAPVKRAAAVDRVDRGRRVERRAPSAVAKAPSTAKASALKPVAEPTVTAPAAPPPPAAPDCNPPYYFEGTKKIFKPSCLGEGH